MSSITIGTCSWKYKSWEGLVYPPGMREEEYLQEYGRQYRTVEVDQWFWSLFRNDVTLLPRADTVLRYAREADPGLGFAIKAPNSITLTHYYRQSNSALLEVNPHFLSVSLAREFLECLTPLASRVKVVIFQFEYLNKQKMSGLREFVRLLGEFVRNLPPSFRYGIECRNPNYLNGDYFTFLLETGLIPVFLHGYYMPPAVTLLERFRSQLGDSVIIRLHGPDRQGMEARTGKDWSQLVRPRDKDLESLALQVGRLARDNVDVLIYVNNHFEGSAPRTIARLHSLLDAAGLGEYLTASGGE